MWPDLGGGMCVFLLYVSVLVCLTIVQYSSTHRACTSTHLLSESLNKVSVSCLHQPLQSSSWKSTVAPLPLAGYEPRFSARCTMNNSWGDVLDEFFWEHSSKWWEYTRRTTQYRESSQPELGIWADMWTDG